LTGVPASCERVPSFVADVRAPCEWVPSLLTGVRASCERVPSFVADVRAPCEWVPSLLTGVGAVREPGLASMVAARVRRPLFFCPE
jgi:hypothetical protein